MRNRDDNAAPPLVLKIKLEIRPVEDREIKFSTPVDTPPPPLRPGLDTAIDANHLRELLKHAPLDTRARSQADLRRPLPKVAVETTPAEGDGRKRDQVSLNDLFPTPLPAPAPISPPGGWELEAPRDPRFLPEDSEADIELTLVIYV